MSSLSLLSCDEAAVELGVTSIRVRQFCQEGRIGQKVGGRWVIPRDELEQFVKIPRETGRPKTSPDA